MKRKKKLGTKATPKCPILTQKSASCSLEEEYSNVSEPNHTKMLKVTMKNDELTFDALSLNKVTAPSTSIKTPTIMGGMVWIFSLKNNDSRDCIMLALSLIYSIYGCRHLSNISLLYLGHDKLRLLLLFSLLISYQLGFYYRLDKKNIAFASFYSYPSVWLAVNHPLG